MLGGMGGRMFGGGLRECKGEQVVEVSIASLPVGCRKRLEEVEYNTTRSCESCCLSCPATANASEAYE
jgi:hypothetical protein